MHWFKRIVIAVVVAWLVTYGLYHSLWEIIFVVSGRSNWTGHEPIVSIIWGLLLPASAVVGIGMERLLARATRADDRPPKETQCRRCGYILRGITEPRCPECGEAI